MVLLILLVFAVSLLVAKPSLAPGALRPRNGLFEEPRYA